MLAAGRLLCGAGFVLCSIYFTKMVVDWFAGRELATAMAILVMSWPFGIAMGQVGHGWLEATQGWRTPFVVASLYCLAGAIAVLVAYRPPDGAAAAAAPSARSDVARMDAHAHRRARPGPAFNAGYVIYLSFAPRVLVAGGLGAFEAASIAQHRELGDDLLRHAVRHDRRPHRPLRSHPLFLPVLRAWPPWRCCRRSPGRFPSACMFGLLGVAPAGIVMALTGAAMAPQKRAFGMGVFLSVFFLLTGPAPALAGWLYDRTADPFVPDPARHRHVRVDPRSPMSPSASAQRATR